MNNKLLIEVNHQDHAYVESVCSDGTFNFESFFSHLLNLYRNSLNEPVQELVQEHLTEKVKSKKKKE
jgi:hypothetical protein